MFSDIFPKHIYLKAFILFDNKYEILMYFSFKTHLKDLNYI